MHIDLDYCPFCNIRGSLNQDVKGWYGWCAICGAEGPHHWDWVKAAKMWNARSFKEMAEANDTTAEAELKRLEDKGFDLTRIKR